jgi:DNA-binding transcriptional MerR regulator
MGMKLDELAERAGVSPRTVRYYIQRGVLPAPDFQGPHTTYDERHLFALRAIKRLQEAYWPLDAIASALAGKSEGELRALSHGPLPELPSAPTKTAKPTAEAPSHPKPVASVRGERITLAPGVELWVEDGADAALVESIVKLSQTHTPQKKKGKP